MAGYTYDPSGFRDVFERSFTYLAGFERNLHRYADAAALHDPLTGRRWTYRELGADVDRLAGALARRGVGHRDVVVLSLLNCPEFALIWLATQRLGAVTAPINFRLSAGEMAYVLDDSAPAVFCFDESVADTAQQALRTAEHTPGHRVVVSTEGATASGAEPFAALLDEDATAPAAPAELTSYDEVTRFYTSGTTGMPKGVSVNSIAEVLTAHDVIMHFPLSPEDKTLNMTPWFHRGGLHPGGPCPVFYLGAESVVMRQFDPGTVLDWVEQHGLTYLVGAPTSLSMLAAAQEEKPRDLGTLKGVVTMGSPLEREACLRYQRVLTPRIFNGYGTTEAFWNTFLRPGDLPEHAGTAGRACTDDDVAVVRVYEDRFAAPDDLAAKDGSEVGEVIVRSPKSGYSYVNQPEEQQRHFRDGWLYIGDLATWDAEEFVTIVGRKDDMIITGGENVHPVQVEEALASHPGVGEVVVVGLPDATWGERVVAYVRRTEGSEGEALTAAECDRHCREHPALADFKRPRGYRFVEDLPLTPTGKKMHYVVREQAVSDADAGLLQTP